MLLLVRNDPCGFSLSQFVDPSKIEYKAAPTISVAPIDSFFSADSISIDYTDTRSVHLEMPQAITAIPSYDNSGFGYPTYIVDALDLGNHDLTQEIM